MTNEQLELGFAAIRPVRRSRRENRNRRAAWWFARMREVVNHAMDWQPANPPRPEQIWLSGTHRQVEV